MRLVEIPSIDHEVFNFLRNSLWANPQTKFGCFSAEYSPLLRMAHFWFHGAEYVPKSIGAFNFREYMILTPQLKESDFSIKPVAGINANGEFLFGDT